MSDTDKKFSGTELEILGKALDVAKKYGETQKILDRSRLEQGCEKLKKDFQSQ